MPDLHLDWNLLVNVAVAMVVVEVVGKLTGWW